MLHGGNRAVIAIAGSARARVGATVLNPRSVRVMQVGPRVRGVTLRNNLATGVIFGLSARVRGAYSTAAAAGSGARLTVSRARRKLFGKRRPR